MKEATKQLFLAELAKHGIVRAAARVANPAAKSARGAATTFYDLRVKDHEFAQAWEDALEEANEVIESEILRRGVEGFEETRVDSNGKVTTLRRYSDPCLLALARARLPAFRKSDVELSGRLETGGRDDARIAAAVRAKADELAKETADVLARLANGELGAL